MSKDDQPSVLYVDDDPINLRVFDANFRSRFKVITCSSGGAAIDILLNRPSEVGVLISDQRMPLMTGIELLEKVRVVAPDVERMVITAYSDMQAVIEAVNRGQVSRYFVKPWVKEELAGVLEDALRIYALRARLRDIEVRMLQSERLAAIGQVSAGIAHELMNPVSYMSQNIATLRGELETLNNYLSPLLAKTPNPGVRQTLDDMPSLLDDIETGAKHIRQVALGVRTQARGEDVEKTSDLADVAEFAVKLARAEVRNRARLVATGPSLKVLGGPVKLTQILLNMIVNSAQAMEGVGRQGLIELGWSDQGDGTALIFVRDNGSGIPAEIQQKVFEPLFTTKAVGVGTGLGLAIARGLIQEMGGEVKLTSQVGVGTKLEITLKKA